MPVLQPGDLLFRWIKKKKEKADFLQERIGNVQEESILHQHEHLQEILELGIGEGIERPFVTSAIPAADFAREIEHVGIFVGEGKVVEVGAGKIGGLGEKAIGARKNTDVVVRFTDTNKATDIADVALKAARHSTGYTYPFHKLFTKDTARAAVKDQVPWAFRAAYWDRVAARAHRWDSVEARALRRGQRDVSEDWGRMHRQPANPVLERRREGRSFGTEDAFIRQWPILEQYEAFVRDSGDPKEPYKVGDGGHEPVCSHFVHAVLYAVLFGGSVRVGTKRETEHIFNISPNMLWHYFVIGAGVFAGQQVALVGVQRKNAFSFRLSEKLRVLLQSQHYYPTGQIHRHVVSLIQNIFQMRTDT